MLLMIVCVTGVSYFRGTSQHLRANTARPEQDKESMAVPSRVNLEKRQCEEKSSITNRKMPVSLREQLHTGWSPALSSPLVLSDSELTWGLIFSSPTVNCVLKLMLIYKFPFQSWLNDCYWIGFLSWIRTNLDKIYEIAVYHKANESWLSSVYLRNTKLV